MPKTLANRITRLVVGAMIGVSLVIIIIATLISYRDISTLASQRQETSARVASHLVLGIGQPFTLDVDRLRAGNKPLNGDNSVVDTIVATVGGTATVFAGDKRIATNVTNPDGSRAIGTRLTNDAVRHTVLEQGLPFRGMVNILGRSFYAAYDPIKSGDGRTIGMIYTGMPADEYTASVYRGVLITALGSILATAIATFLTLRVVRRMMLPLVELCASIESLSGDTAHIIIPHTERTDEIGQIAQRLQSFHGTDRARREAEAAQSATAMTILAKHLAKLAEGDLCVRVGNTLPAAFADVGRDCDALAESLGQAMAGIIDSSDRIHQTAVELRDATQDLSRRTEMQAANLTETATSMRDFTSASEQSAINATEANLAMDDLHDQLDHSDGSMVKTVAAMHAIAASSNEIADIATLIDGIAFQTNLLALNAGVEAARAGDAGRGFAVVASEVRALAQRSAEAAHDVKERIARSANEVAQGVRLVDGIGATVREAGANAARVGGLMKRIADSAQTQSTGITRISAVLGEMDRMTQQNAAMVEEATAATGGLTNESASLHAEVARFNIDRGGIVVNMAQRRRA